MDVKLNPRPLETHVDWTRDDVQDESAWTVELTDADKRELDHALTVAKSHSDNLLDIGLGAVSARRARRPRSKASSAS